MTAVRRLAGRAFHVLAEEYRRLVSGAARFACAVCGRRVRAFRPLPEFYFNQLEAGWPHSLDQAETCSVPAVLVPGACRAADRDRLIALYLDEYLHSTTGPATVIDSTHRPPRCRRSFCGRSQPATGHTVPDGGPTHRRRRSGRCDRHAAVRLRVGGLVAVFPRPGARRGRPQGDAGTAADLAARRAGCPARADRARAGRDRRGPVGHRPASGGGGSGKDDHVRLYCKSGFVGRLREAGFIVHELGADHFAPDRFVEQGICSSSVLYVVESRASPRLHKERPG